jgi:hypothetical protein
VFEGVYVLRWGLRPQLSDVPAYAAEIAAARQRQGKPLVAVFIMPRESAAPDETFRKCQARHLPHIFTSLECAVCVFEGSGFVASLKRSALATILMLSPNRHPIYVRSTLEDALVRDPPQRYSFDARSVLAEVTQRMADAAA